MSVNGFYAGFFTGNGGNGLALFVLQDGILTGADMAAVVFDGNYAPDNSGFLTGTVAVSVPPGVTIIQGITAPPQGLRYEVPLRMPADFAAQPFLEISTPFGNVNVRMQKLRDISK